MAKRKKFRVVKGDALTPASFWERALIDPQDLYKYKKDGYVLSDSPMFDYMFGNMLNVEIIN